MQPLQKRLPANAAQCVPSLVQKSDSAKLAVFDTLAHRWTSAANMPCPLTRRGIDAFRQRRNGNYSHHAASLKLDRHQCAIQRHAVNEGLRSHPSDQQSNEIHSSRAVREILLPGWRRRETRRYPRTEQLFRFSIGDRNRRIIRL